MDPTLRDSGNNVNDYSAEEKNTHAPKGHGHTGNQGVLPYEHVLRVNQDAKRGTYL